MTSVQALSYKSCMLRGACGSRTTSKPERKPVSGCSATPPGSASILTKGFISRRVAALASATLQPCFHKCQLWPKSQVDTGMVCDAASCDPDSNVPLMVMIRGHCDRSRRQYRPLRGMKSAGTRKLHGAASGEHGVLSSKDSEPTPARARFFATCIQSSLRGQGLLRSHRCKASHAVSLLLCMQRPAALMQEKDLTHLCCSPTGQTSYQNLRCIQPATA